MRSRIEALGTATIRGVDGKVVQSVLQQPRRFALLVYLAIASRRGPVRRDLVVGAFWPDSTQDRARGSLNQAIHYLRKALGAAAVITAGPEEIALCPDRVGCDAADLLDACDRQDWAEAARLYRGELLPGFFDGAGSGGLDRWLMEERERLRTRAAQAGWELAAAELDRGEKLAAGAWARRAVEWSLHDEGSVRRLMELLDKLDDRAGVLEAYRALADRLRVDDDDVAPATSALLARIRADWEQAPAVAADDGLPLRPCDERPPAASVQSVTAGPGARLAIRRFAGHAATLLLTIGLVGFWGLARPHGVVPAAQRPVIVVESTQPNDALHAMVGHLVSDVVGYLGEARHLDVRVETGPARQANAYALQLSVREEESALRVTAHLVEPTTGRRRASVKVDAADEDGLGEAARRVATLARLELGRAEAARRIESLPGSTPAAEAQLRLARGDMTRGDSLGAAGRGDLAVVAYRKADSTLVAATKLAPAWAAPHALRAEVAHRRLWLALRDGSMPRAQAEAREGFRLATMGLRHRPTDVEALDIRSQLAYLAWTLSTPDPADTAAHWLAHAEGDLRRVTAIDPTRSRAWSTLGWLLYQRGAWPETLWALDRAIETDAYLEQGTETWLRLFEVALEVDDEMRAQRACVRLGNWYRAYCRLALTAYSGHGTSVDQIAELLATSAPSSAEPYLGAAAAAAYSRMGEVERAHRTAATVLERAAGHPDMGREAAWALRATGRDAEAADVLTHYIAVSPAARQFMATSWRFNR
jgi:DNA-binding SARP family transcriptional activator